MLVSFSFRGTELELDDQLFYYAAMDYWVAFDRGKKEIFFGLTPAAPVKEGGFRHLEFTIKEGDKVKAGEIIAVAVTAKIKYLETPASGTVVKLNRELEQNMVECFAKMDLSWLAQIHIENLEETLPLLVDCAAYYKILKSSEGYFLPPGIKGAGSPTCRSVYESIREEKK